MTANVAPPGLTQILTDNGEPAALYRLYTYDAGTNTPRTTWADSAEGVANANPVVLDANGRAQIYYRGSYKLVLKTPADAVVWTQDNFNVVDPSASTSTVFANGSAATPSVRFAQATSSGLFSPAANVVAMSINGAEAARWSAGNYGIGGTPTQKLDVFGTARIQGALTITTGGITVTAGGATITAGGLTVTAGGATIAGTVGITGATTVTGAMTVAGGIFSSRGFVDNATTAAWNIDASGRLLNNGAAQPMFRAVRSASQQSSGSTLICDSEVNDVGGIYNNATGVFTAPVAGVYIITAGIACYNVTGSDQGMGFSITASVAGALGGDTMVVLNTTTFAGSAACVCRLSAGETVSVLISNTLSANLVLQNTGQTYFSGVLLG